MFSTTQKRILVITIFLSLSLLIAVHVKNTTTEAAPIQAKIIASDGATEDWFGKEAAISGNFAIVGSPMDDDLGDRSGSAYIYEKAGGVWTNEVKLSPADLETFDQFGTSIDIEGNYAAVGASYANGTTTVNAGAVYIYYYNGANWSQQAKITARNSGGNDEGVGDTFGGTFGNISISGDYIIIGSSQDDNANGIDAGSAYIYKRTGAAWNWVAKLMASDGAAGDYFGESAGFSGNYVIVGGSRKNTNTGAAYTFYKDEGGVDNWGQQAILTASDGGINDWFAGPRATSISGDYAIIGGQETAGAYIFHRTGGSTWVEEDKITVSDASGGYFGYSTSISGDYAVITAPWDDDMGSGSGSAYVFKRDGTDWVRIRKVTASDGAGADLFGIHSSLDTSSFIIGSHYDDNANGNDAGSAYVFTNFECTIVTSDFTDANFANCVETALGTPGLVCQEDAAALTSLNCDSQSISSIAGAENLTGLTDLNILFNTISDVTPLSGLTALTDLGLNGNNISDISALSGLTNLIQLGLDGGNNISDISALSGLTALTGLGLGGNNISDISALSGLTNLTNLGLHENNISDISDLSGLTNLQILWLQENSISDISDLSGMTDLIRLGLTGNNISDISALSGLIALLTLDLATNNISDISALSGMSDLTNLTLNENNISDLSPIGSGNGNIANFASGNNINISDNPLHDQADLDEVDLLEANGATVTHNITLFVCGNGITEGTEQCDDNNTNSGDGCSSACFIEFPANGDETKIMATDGADWDRFGSVDIDGNYAIVGAYYGDGAVADSGSAYIYYYDGVSWVEQDKLIASDGTASDYFGNSVSISGDYAVVAAFLDAPSGIESGSAYLYQRSGSTWTQIKKLTAGDGEAGDRFGQSISIDGNYIVVGAVGESLNPGDRQGAAYVFYKDQGGVNNWGQQQKLTASDRANDDSFGGSVSLSGDSAIIGAGGKDVGGNSDQGAAYVFTRSGVVWSEQSKITSADGESSDGFGASVSIDHDLAIISAPNEDEGGSEAGSAYIFRGGWGFWNQEDKIIINDAAAQDYLGVGPSGVFIYGDYAAVSTFYTDDYGNNSGAAYIFRYHGASADWIQERKFNASDSAADDYFGKSIAMSNDYFIAGADYDTNARGTNAGSAYIYDLSTCGDGFQLDSEQCDDNNLVSGDGCSATCKMEFFPNENETKVWAFNGAESDGFGSVSIYGDYAIAGSWQDDDIGINSGSAYIFKKSGDTWTSIKKLTASDSAEEVLFGISVSMYGDYAVVGAFGDDIGANVDQGSAYIYYKDQGGVDNWGEVKKLTASDGAGDDKFGVTVFLNGNQLIVGAGEDDDLGLDSGSAYIFYKDQGGADNWGEVKKLTASDGGATDYFGYASINGDYAIVGAYGDDDEGANAGAAYIFAKDNGGADNWGEIKKLTASDGNMGTYFGNSVSIDGNYALVGCYYQSWGGMTDAGAAYLFYKDQGGVDNWGEVKKLTASDALDFNHFGTSVSIQGNYIMVGEGGDFLSESGSAYLFSKDEGGLDNWGELTKIIPSDGETGDYFGGTGMLFGDYAIIGSTYDDDLGIGSGSAYIYELNYCGDNFLYGTEQCDDGGESATCDNDCTLVVCGDNNLNVTAGEECDDGNIIGGDGCSATCTTEGGGSSNPSAPVCGVQPTAMNLPEEIPVSQIGGKPSVGISWNKLDVQEINADQKIQLLFDYFGQIISPTIGENGIKLENVFARYMYDKIMDDAGLKASFTSKLDTAIKAGVDLAKCDCIGDIAEAVVNTVRSMRNVTSIKAKTDDLILGFINDVLNLERTLKETGQGVRTPFTNFFNRNFANAALEGLIVDVFRDGRLIYTEENPNNTSYTDNSIPLNDTGRVKYYSYHLVSRNNCGQAWGSVGKAKIDPIVPAGTAIDTTLDLSIRIKDGYSQLFIDRLREVLNGNSQGTTTVMEQIYEHEDYLAMVNTCSSAQTQFMASKTSDLALEYIIKCYASGNPALIAKIQEREADIVQPLIKLINLDEGGSGLESLINMFINSVIQNLLNEIETENIVKESIGSLGLNTQTLLLRQRMEDFTQDEKEKIKLLNENLFEGAGHAANLVIEKYDDKNVLLDSYRVRTDVFGEAKGISIGKLSSGKEYTIKIRLFDERFVLPKVVKLTINNAEPTSEGKYKTTVAMNFTKHFRYGDFNEDDTIDLDDIVAWGEVLSGKVPGDGEQYGMFDMWKFGNLDGLAGINLSDALTLQENWGGLKELTLEEGQMSLSDLLGMFGFTVISAFQGELESGVNVPAWIDIVETDCRN